MSWTERPPGMPLGAWLRAYAKPAAAAAEDPPGPPCDMCGRPDVGTIFNAAAGESQCALCREFWTRQELDGEPIPVTVRRYPRMLAANGYGRDVLDWLAAR